MSGKKGKKYKRSWKNLLLDKGYQLRFSLFMAGMAAVLMFLLGWWVMDVAGQATKVSKQGVSVCIPPAAVKVKRGALKVPPIPAKVDKADPVPADKVDGADAPVAPDATKDEAKKAGKDEAKKPGKDETKKAGDKKKTDSAADGADGADGAEDRPKVQVVLDDENNLNEAAIAEMLIDVDKVVNYFNCRMITRAQLNDLESGQRLIFWVLVVVGFMMVIGLTIYGLKMTHKVAGPLHKVSLYMDKMKAGRYDTVWNLRKGDQLVEFYDHFKSAHAGMKTMQNEDVEQLRGVIEAADAADIGSLSPELAAALDEMREMLARKEKGLE